MSILLDTHIVIWMATAPDSVPAALQTKIAGADKRFISTVSFAEVAFKHRKYPERFAFTIADMEQAFLDLKAIELPLTRAHLQEFHRLRPRHKDPFDHLLISQALAEDIEFASMDAEIGKYRADGVRVAF